MSLPISIRFTSMMLSEIRIVFKISTKAIYVKLFVDKTSPRKSMFISICFLIVIVVEYFKTRGTVIEIVA